jgi:tetratricopeptide (TPR) repeat protein
MSVRPLLKSPALHEEEVRSLLSELPPGKDGALLHVLTCPFCRGWAIQRLGQEVGGEDFPEYEAIWGRLEERLPEMLFEAERRNLAAEGLLVELLGSPAAERSEALRNPRFWSVDLLELLLEASREAQGKDGERSEALALLGLQLTGYLRADMDEIFSAMFFARASVLRANALRLRGELVAAEDALGRAAHFLLWPFESADRAVYGRALALLRWEQGHYDEAEALLRHAARSFREYLLTEEAGACWALLGLLLLEADRTAEAARCLQTGRALLDPAARPWLTVRTGLSLALATADLGQTERAHALWRETWSHYRQVQDESEQVRIGWLEGKILVRLGRRDDAEPILWAVRDRLFAAGRLPEAVLCSLDLAVVLLEGGREAELPQLLRAVEEAFPKETVGLDGLRRAYAAFLTSLQGVSTLPRPFVGIAEAALRRVFLSRGYRVESLPFV